MLITLNMAHLMPTGGQAVHTHTELAHNVPHDEPLNDDATKMSHTVPYS